MVNYIVQHFKLRLHSNNFSFARYHFAARNITYKIHGGASLLMIYLGLKAGTFPSGGERGKVNWI